MNEAEKYSTALADAASMLVTMMDDPDGVHAAAALARGRLLVAVEAVAAAERDLRAAGVVTARVVASEVRALSTVVELCEALGRVFTDGAKRAKSILGEVVLDTADDQRRGNVTVKVGGKRGTIAVSRVVPTVVDVDVAELADILVEYIGGMDWPDHKAAVACALEEYWTLAARHTFRSTQLDRLGRDLELAERDDLAIRLGHAYGRVPKGDAQVRIVREEEKS